MLFNHLLSHVESRSYNLNDMLNLQGRCNLFLSDDRLNCHELFQYLRLPPRFFRTTLDFTTPSMYHTVVMHMSGNYSMTFHGSIELRGFSYNDVVLCHQLSSSTCSLFTQSDKQSDFKKLLGPSHPLPVFPIGWHHCPILHVFSLKSDRCRSEDSMMSTVDWLTLRQSYRLIILRGHEAGWQQTHRSTVETNTFTRGGYLFTSECFNWQLVAFKPLRTRTPASG